MFKFSGGNKTSVSFKHANAPFCNVEMPDDFILPIFIGIIQFTDRIHQLGYITFCCRSVVIHIETRSIGKFALYAI